MGYVHGVSESPIRLSDYHYFYDQMCCEQLSSPPSPWLARDVPKPLADWPESVMVVVHLGDPLLDSWGLEKGGKDKRK